MTDPKEKPVGQTQHERFKDAARALDCDEDEAAFDEKLKGIARQKPKTPAPLPKDDEP